MRKILPLFLITLLIISAFASCSKKKVQIKTEDDTKTETLIGEGDNNSDENSDNEIYEIGYKIYDSENYVVASGKLSTSNKLTAGDKFKDESVTIDGLTPGETYTLVLVNE